MNQLERNVVQSFSLAKSDIRTLRYSVNSLRQNQEKLLQFFVELQQKEQMLYQRMSTESKSTSFVVSRKAKKFHTENCPFAANIKQPKRFDSKEEARLDGFTPCKCV